MQLTSSHNSRLQEVSRAAKAGRPTPEGLIVAEGPNLLQEVSCSPWKIIEVFCTKEASIRFSSLLEPISAPLTEVAPRAWASLTTTENSQGLIALLEPARWAWKDVLADPALAVVVDTMQDPGNVGATIRSAEAFGAGGIVLTQGCARVSNGKVLRSAAGSLFRLPYLESVGYGEILRQFASRQWRLYALAANGGTAIQDVDFRGSCGLLVGSEGAGLSQELLAKAESIRIPTVQVESLNAAVACSIALFEAARQRSTG